MPQIVGHRAIVLKVFLDNPGRAFWSGDLARITGLGQKDAGRALRGLVAGDWITGQKNPSPVPGGADRIYYTRTRKLTQLGRRALQ
jgi:hypothetical protein